jgi:hypothetical protein
VTRYDASPTPESLFSRKLQGMTLGQFVQDPETAKMRQKTLISVE